MSDSNQGGTPPAGGQNPYGQNPYGQGSPSGENPYGVAGTDVCLTDGPSGAPPRLAADHGSMSPWNVRNTLLAWGADVKRGVTVRAPAGNVDVVPTVLSLLGLADESGVDGRVLSEALVGGPDHDQVRHGAQ